MPPARVTLRVPATTANLGPGFDCLGMALALAAEVTVWRADGDAPETVGPSERTVTDAAVAAFRALNREAPLLGVEFGCRTPVERGLGASAANRAAGLLAAEALTGGVLGRERLFALGVKLEGHADNIAACLFGGLQVAVLGERGPLHAGVPLPPGLRAVLFVPEFRMPTEESRRVLPATVSRADAVYNISRAALLVAALATGNLQALDEATRDRLHQPARARLFPPMEALMGAARKAGALGAFLSGGGSSVLALTTTAEDRIAQALEKAARQAGIAGEVIVSEPSLRGAEVVEAE